MNRLIHALPAILIAVTATVPSVSAQEPANPVAFTVSCSIPSGQTTCNAQVNLPGGKRAVIENVSVKATAPSGQTIQLHVATSSMNLPSGTLVSRNYVVLTPAKNGTTYFANHPVRIYSTTGSYIQILGQRITFPAGAAGAVQYEVWFSGYLLP